MNLRVALICGRQGLTLLSALPEILKGHTLRSFLSPAAWRDAQAQDSGLELGSVCLPLPETGTFEDTLAGFRPDVILVMSYLGKLPPHLARYTRFGMVNMHPSLLPQYRGAAPIFHAIRDGAAVSGLTYHYLNDDFDAGPIIAQFPIKIQTQDCAQSLWLKINRRLLTTLPDLLECIETWAERATPQDGACATSAPAPDLALCRLSPTHTTMRNLRIIRACTTIGGAVLEDQAHGTIRVTTATPDLHEALASGNNQPLSLQTRDGRLFLTSVHPISPVASMALI
ncbi:hypothetical protein GTA62_19370 [Roseobacter sp. HKCCD9010]|uniref:methionyl-tRNA formyltransferase n=1 Tax=unclassified Roseobacter TaxID=196798 RepID=UPI001492E36C|nr:MULTISPECIES: formyltransferase family protein [unclassified Roseobacter]MBF9052147.1 hypothetical protein [Rhodobacterales bacterium HKCCD4356]NNV14102.1 hypothetical protein [Roseobacter sp. HKCCD7357]NNV18307.1 hypothetical protein [Roseobacter sp. HKCCD8768]NNV27766.1 hypothetical protein [Roseobacter sp. HKCCD8192]NNV32041.1 hypothetical protein [Roseobacter sp. HKCCD9061]